MDDACRTQLLTQAAGRPKPRRTEIARHTAGQIGGARGAQLSFESLYEVIVADQPDFLE